MILQTCGRISAGSETHAERAGDKVTMFQRINNQQIGLVIVLFLFACSPKNTPSITETNEPIASSSPVVYETVTMTTTPLPTVAVDTIESLVLDPNYLKGCHELNPTVSKEQASYNGIFPGKTTSAEVKKLIGEPKSTFLDGLIYNYDYYSIEFEEEVVTVISVGSYLLLREVIETYGCPEAIFAFHLTSDDPASEKPGSLGMVRFVYPTIGFEFEIYNYPARLSEEIYGLYYFVPKSLHDYIYDKTFIKQLLEPDQVKLVTWDEAVEE